MNSTNIANVNKKIQLLKFLAIKLPISNQNYKLPINCLLTILGFSQNQCTSYTNLLSLLNCKTIVPLNLLEVQKLDTSFGFGPMSNNQTPRLPLTHPLTTS